MKVIIKYLKRRSIRRQFYRQLRKLSEATVPYGHSRKVLEFQQRKVL
jgi:hypothetical protein